MHLPKRSLSDIVNLVENQYIHVGGIIDLDGKTRNANDDYEEARLSAYKAFLDELYGGSGIVVGDADDAWYKIDGVDAYNQCKAYREGLGGDVSKPDPQMEVADMAASRVKLLVDDYQYLHDCPLIHKAIRKRTNAADKSSLIFSKASAEDFDVSLTKVFRAHLPTEAILKSGKDLNKVWKEDIFSEEPTMASSNDEMFEKLLERLDRNFDRSFQSLGDRIAESQKETTGLIVSSQADFTKAVGDLAVKLDDAISNATEQRAEIDKSSRQYFWGSIIAAFGLTAASVYYAHTSNNSHADLHDIVATKDDVSSVQTEVGTVATELAKVATALETMDEKNQRTQLQIAETLERVAGDSSDLETPEP